MNKKVKEPFQTVRAVNLVLGLVILFLVAVVVFQKDNSRICELFIFALAALENFIGATVSFSTHKKVRGNVYAIVGTAFLIMALIMAVQCF